MSIYLIIGFLLHPASRVSSHEGAPRLVVNPNGQTEWESWEPPRPTDGPHAECDIQAWAVAEEAGEDSFEQEAEIQRLVRHSLLENRILTRLGNDQIGPLYNDNRDEIRCVAIVFERLSLIVTPFLSIRVLQIVDGFGIPKSSQADQFGRHKTILCHDHEIHEESSRCLNHADLSVSQ